MVHFYLSSPLLGIAKKVFPVEPFYGEIIDPEEEQEQIDKILFKYKSEPASEDLKKKIYNELAAAKAAGIISIPFKIVMRKASTPAQVDLIEVILDTKV